MPGYWNFGSATSSTGMSVVRSSRRRHGSTTSPWERDAAARFDLCSGRMPVIVIVARGYSKENPKNRGAPGRVGVYPRILGVQAARPQNRSHWSVWRQQIRAAIARAFLCRQRAPRAFSRRPSVLAAPSTTPLPIASPRRQRPAVVEPVDVADEVAQHPVQRRSPSRRVLARQLLADQPADPGPALLQEQLAAVLVERGRRGRPLAEEPLAGRGDVLAGVVDVQRLAAPGQRPPGRLPDPRRPVAQHVQLGPSPAGPAAAAGPTTTGGIASPPRCRPTSPAPWPRAGPATPTPRGSPARPSAASGPRRSSGRASPSRGC